VPPPPPLGDVIAGRALPVIEISADLEGANLRDRGMGPGEELLTGAGNLPGFGRLFEAPGVWNARVPA
jgi:hypothetical protein